MLLSNIIHVSCAIETDFPATIAQNYVIRKPQDRTFSNSFLATWSKWRHHLWTTWVMSNIESQNRCWLERAKWPLMARWCVLQSGKQGSAHWRVWVISHWGKQLKVTVSLKAVICWTLITLTCPPLAPHSAACQTMRGEEGRMETNRNERMARTTVTDEEGADLPSLVKRPSIIDEGCVWREGDPADHTLASNGGNLKMTAWRVSLRLNVLLRSHNWDDFWMSQLCNLQKLCYIRKA